MSEPFISVVIPTRHRNDFLARCLERLAPGMQTLEASNYEVIVTDDGQTSTAEFMVRSTFPWARWIKGPGRGPAANRNYGAHHARSQWIAFTDDDCIPSSEWLAAFRDAMEPGTEIYEGKTTCQAGMRPWVEEVPLNLEGGNLWSCNMVVGKALYQQMGGFDEDFVHPMMEDIDFHERVVRGGYPVKWSPEAVVDHPPRPRRKASAQWQVWENRVRLIFKHDHRRSVVLWLPLRLVRNRVREIFDLGVCKESLTAMGHSAVELFTVLIRVGAWQRKYRARYARSSERRVP